MKTITYTGPDELSPPLIKPNGGYKRLCRGARVELDDDLAAQALALPNMIDVNAPVVLPAKTKPVKEDQNDTK